MKSIDIKLLETYLLLERKPVGVKFHFRNSHIIKEALRPKKPLYFCSALALASNGRRILLKKEDLRCEASVRNLCFETLSDKDFADIVAEYLNFGIYEDESSARSVLGETIKVRNKFLDEKSGQRIHAVEVFPLDNENFDICIFVGSPKTIMRIIQGYAFHFGSMRDLSVSGMHGICFETVFRVFAYGKPQISLLCSGARHFGRFKDYEMSIAFHKKMLCKVTEGIMKTAESCEDDFAKEKIEKRAEANRVNINLSRRKAYIYFD